MQDLSTKSAEEPFFRRHRQEQDQSQHIPFGQPSHLAFPDHVHDFISLDRPPGPMILFHYVCSSKDRCDSDSAGLAFPPPLVPQPPWDTTQPQRDMLPENIRDLDESEMIVFPVGSKEDESPITRPTSSRDDGTQIHITSVEHYFEHCLSWLENPG
jgi:hypothetical protein